MQSLKEEDARVGLGKHGKTLLGMMRINRQGSEFEG
jgi:hypothetical protein